VLNKVDLADAKLLQVVTDTYQTVGFTVRVLQCVAVCCSVLQCVAVCCSVLQCVAVCCFSCLKERVVLDI